MTKPSTPTDTLIAMLQHPSLKAIHDKAGLAKRLNAMGFTRACNRCGGSGRFSYNQHDGDTCYGCSGAGHVPESPSRALVDRVAAAIEAGALEAYAQDAIAKARLRKRALAATQQIKAAEAETRWRAYHYPPESRTGDRLERYSWLSYSLHDEIGRAVSWVSDRANDMRYKRAPADRQAACEALAARIDEMVHRIQLVDAIFAELLEAGEIAADAAAGRSVKGDYSQEVAHRTAASKRARLLIAERFQAEGLEPFLKEAP